MESFSPLKERFKSVKEQAYFPMFISLEGKKIVVVGGGKIAARRIQTLVEFAKDILVIAPNLEESIKEFGRRGSLSYIERAFKDQDIRDAYVVIAATNEEEVNNHIYDVCKERGILINHAGNQEKCDFFFPGIVKKDQLVIGVTASGKNHKLVKKVTKIIRDILPQQLEFGEENQ